MTPNDIISITANNLGDGGFAALNREEYEGFLNDVAHDIWMQSKAQHRLRHYDLPAGQRAFTLPDTDIIEFAELQVRVGLAPAPGSAEPEVFTPDEAPAHEQEKPIHQNIAENQGIYTNVGNVVPHFHLTPEYRNGQYTIHSVRPFESGTKLHVHAVIFSPRYSWIGAYDFIDPTTGLDPQGNTLAENLASSLWEPLRNVFTEGMLWRAARRLSNYSMDPTRRRIWDDAKSLYYSKYLPDAIHFIHSLKDSSAALHVQPFKYLTEPPI